MSQLSNFDPNVVGNPNNNIFGLPFSEEESSLVLLPVPWEVTVSYGAGTSRAAEHIWKASIQVDLFDTDVPDGWKKGFYLRESNKKILLKSDYLRKEAELFIDYISKGEKVEETQWHNLVAWGKTAEIIEKYVTKGKEIAIEGKLTHRTYEDKNGEKRYITDIVANEVLLLGK